MCNYMCDPSKAYCPCTHWMCEEAESYCESPSNNRGCECCGPRNRPCCIDCFYCLAPLGYVYDLVCFPINCYIHCNENNQDVAQAI